MYPLTTNPHKLYDCVYPGEGGSLEHAYQVSLPALQAPASVAGRGHQVWEHGCSVESGVLTVGWQDPLLGGDWIQHVAFSAF